MKIEWDFSCDLSSSDEEKQDAEEGFRALVSSVSPGSLTDEELIALVKDSAPLRPSVKKDLFNAKEAKQKECKNECCSSVLSDSELSSAYQIIAASSTSSPLSSPYSSDNEEVIVFRGPYETPQRFVRPKTRMNEPQPKPKAGIRKQKRQSEKRSDNTSTGKQTEKQTEKQEEREAEKKVEALTRPPYTQPLLCRCKKSRCLKLYCVCFSASRYCDKMCMCLGCKNTSSNAEEVNETQKTRRSIRPAVANSDVSCTCKKNKCLQLYCRCFAAGKVCSDACSCSNCGNDGSPVTTEFEQMLDTVKAQEADINKKRKRCGNTSRIIAENKQAKMDVNVDTTAVDTQPQEQNNRLSRAGFPLRQPLGQSLRRPLRTRRQINRAFLSLEQKEA